MFTFDNSPVLGATWLACSSIRDWLIGGSVWILLSTTKCQGLKWTEKRQPPQLLRGRASVLQISRRRRRATWYVLILVIPSRRWNNARITRRSCSSTTLIWRPAPLPHLVSKRALIFCRCALAKYVASHLPRDPLCWGANLRTYVTRVFRYGDVWEVSRTHPLEVTSEGVWGMGDFSYSPSGRRVCLWWPSAHGWDPPGLVLITSL
jgi:hypothetical protein